MNIYVSISDYNPEAIQLLKEHNHNITLRPSSLKRPTEDELIEIVSEYDGIIIGIKERMTERVYTSARGKLKFAGTLSIGTDHIHQNFFGDKNIQVFNCPTSNVPSVTEYTFAMLLELIKKTSYQHKYTIGDNSSKPKSRDLYNKYFGIIGAGNIAQSVMKASNTFGINTLCWTFHPENHKKLTDSHGLQQFLPLDELFEKSDLIGLYLPSTNESKGIVSRELLSKMKKTSYFISISRLELVDVEYLIEQVREGHIAGAAIDADWTPELIEKVRDLDNFIASSHVAGTNSDADVRIDLDMASTVIESFDRNP